MPYLLKWRATPSETLGLNAMNLFGETYQSIVTKFQIDRRGTGQSLWSYEKVIDQGYTGRTLDVDRFH
jgi:hypothetical protein